MIEAISLSKSYIQTEIVNRFSCRIPVASVVGLLGANGAGKSTIIKMLTGYLAPSSGQARIGGYDVLTEPVQARRLLGYLPQTTPLYDDLRVNEYLAYVAALKKLAKNERERDIPAIIARCGLAPVYRQKIARLSRGYRQRTGLAQALLGNPPALILDEPTSALDPVQIWQTRQLLRELGQTKAVLLSTHILTEVEQICDAVIILHKGRIVLQGNLAQLLRQYRNNLEDIYRQATSAEKVI